MSRGDEPNAQHQRLGAERIRSLRRVPSEYVEDFLGRLDRGPYARNVDINAAVERF